MEMVSTEAVGASRSLKWLAIEMNEKHFTSKTSATSASPDSPPAVTLPMTRCSGRRQHEGDASQDPGAKQVTVAERPVPLETSMIPAGLGPFLVTPPVERGSAFTVLWFCGSPSSIN